MRLASRVYGIKKSRKSATVLREMWLQKEKGATKGDFVERHVKLSIQTGK